MKLQPLLNAVAALIWAGASVTNAATPEQWRSRSIYQLLTDRFARADSNTTATCNTKDGNYCGGSWRGIINQLDYIQDMGFTAIWISPITLNIPDRTPFGYAYHGYWQQDLYGLNEHFGTADDLKALRNALHDRDMYLIVDVVVNHNGWNGGSALVEYEKFWPFDDKKYYHDFCTIGNWSNQTEVEECWLGDSNVELPDLRTEDQDVVDVYSTWIEQLVSNYSIDGLRIDTVKHVDKPFWSSFASAASTFTMGEVFSSNSSFTCDYQNQLDSVLNYPAYYAFTPFFNSTKHNTSSLLSILNDMKEACKDVTVLGTFIENHDVPRLASQTSDMSLAKNALALTLMWDGIPIVYAGQEQHYKGYADPANREATWLSGYSRDSELYKLVASINAVRSRAITVDDGYLTYNINSIYNDEHTVAFRKGYDGNQIISVITNNGNKSGNGSLGLDKTGWGADTEVLEVLSCVRSSVDAKGNLNVPMNDGLPRVYIATEATKGSGICQDTDDHGQGKKGTAAGRRRPARALAVAVGLITMVVVVL